jgi:(p)ppGpp synthase/HD superfamily hydrolase
MEQKAKLFAKEKHKHQKYGEHEYDVHFLEVYSLVKKYHGSFNAIVASLLHDTIEDTQTTKEEISQEFSTHIANIVERLTDKPGKNRTERHLKTYHLIRQCEDATLVKLCDRLANMSFCLRMKDYAKAKMYVKEYMAFKFALYSDLTQHQSVYDKLDETYEQLQQMIKGK